MFKREHVLPVWLGMLLFSMLGGMFAALDVPEMTFACFVCAIICGVTLPIIFDLKD